MAMEQTTDTRNKKNYLQQAAGIMNIPGNWEWDLNQNTIASADVNFKYKTPSLQAETLLQIGAKSALQITNKRKISIALRELQQQSKVYVVYNLHDKSLVKTFEASFHLINNPLGKPSVLQCSFNDITAKTETEFHLEKLKESFEQAERMTHNGNWTFDFDTNKITCSDNLYRIFGYEPGAFEPTIENLLALLMEDQQKIIKERVHEALQTNIFPELELKVKCAGNKEKYIVSRIKEISANTGRHLLIGTLHDVTAEKKLRSQYQEHTALAEMLIENSVDMIAAFDYNLNFIAWNKKCEEHYKLKKDKVIGKHILEVFPHFASKQIMQQLEKAKKGKSIQYKNRHFQAANEYYESYIIPLQHAPGNVFGILMITHDITEIKKSSARLNELNQVLLQKNEEFERSNQELASFSYVASHDLQEPLRKIQTFSHRIQEKEFERLSLQGKEYLTRMAAAAERMQALIEDLLTFSRTNTGPRVFQKTDLNKMMEQIISDLKDNIEEKSAVVEYKNLPSVHVVSFQFKQLMENLILNSLKYHKKNQPPHIKIKAVPAKGNLITEWDADKNKIYYVIEIKDNGIGFEQRYATKIFELFQRLHGKSEYPGTGLGLAICKKIIQNHHGFIIAKGEPGKGASFIIYLPE
jgi:two-component system, chemotaxis family, CheB/CheR fusion protein